MARIRTIKPEFPHSESMGRVSRDARLCFIELWTIADDSGRLRGNSRMLASLLFPYDDDAPDKIGDWLGELEREDCIQRYKHDGQSYLQILNWFAHQKIDKRTASRLPPPPNPREPSPTPREEMAEPPESSGEDLGPRTKDQGRDQGEEGNGEDIPPVLSEWWKSFQKETAILRAPGRGMGSEVEAGIRLAASYDPATLSRAVDYYWTHWRSFWWACRDKRKAEHLREPSHSFKGFAAHVDDVIQAMDAPEPTAEDVPF